MPHFSALHIVGSRPQFAKVAAVSRALARVERVSIEQRLLHTGQHYDANMSEVFFNEFGLEAPQFNLEVGSGSMGYQTGSSLHKIFDSLGDWRPDMVVIYGDTNATLAGSIAAKQQHLPVAHVEAGVRTGDLSQAEELNRVIADRICDLRFCCTEFNLQNLNSENLTEGSYFTGDTMLDNYNYCLPRVDNSILGTLDLTTDTYILSTLHRAENVDHPERLNRLIDGLKAVQTNLRQVVLPIHPRTRHAIKDLGREGELEQAGIKVIKPQGFSVLQALLINCHSVVSDSGGLLRESYFAGKFCTVPWDCAVWPEIVEAGCASVGTIEPQDFFDRVAQAPRNLDHTDSEIFGSGNAGENITELLLAHA